MKVAKRHIIALLLLSLVSLAKAQEYTYYLSTDTIWYSIGGRIMVTHEWSKPEGVEATQPELPPNLKKLERVDLGKVELNKVDGKEIFKQSAVYTCFDTGYYEIRPLGWKVNDDSIFSNPIFVEINMLPVDTSQEIMDIENPLSVPYTFKEALPIIGITLAAAILIILLILYLRYRKRKKLGLIKKEPEKPAHILAFEKLNALKEQKLWQQGKLSEYYFQLSIIIRTYIEKRYGVDALDLTTHELAQLGSQLDVDKSLIQRLIKSLKMGDLAKFAKANPLPNENEEAWNVIDDFVRKTFKEIKEEDAE